MSSKIRVAGVAISSLVCIGLTVLIARSFWVGNLVIRSSVYDCKAQRAWGIRQWRVEVCRGGLAVERGGWLGFPNYSCVGVGSTGATWIRDLPPDHYPPARRPSSGQFSVAGFAISYVDRWRFGIALPLYVPAILTSLPALRMIWRRAQARRRLGSGFEPILLPRVT